MQDMEIKILKHIQFEEPGFFLNVFREYGFDIDFCNLYEGDDPDKGKPDVILVMGGPMNIHDEESNPWLKIEKEYILSCINEKKVVIGVCLGAQLIASVLGAEVYKNKTSEIGWFPVKKEADGKLAFLPDFATVLHWHGDTFQLPAGASRIYSSDATENQAFMYEKHVIGLQFHLEMTPEIVKSLAEESEDHPNGSEYVMTTEKMIELYPRYKYSNQKMLESLVHYMLSLNGLLKK